MTPNKNVSVRKKVNKKVLCVLTNGVCLPDGYHLNVLQQVF